MKKVANIAAGFFIFAVMILGTISVLGVWEYFGRDVIWKSFQSVGLLAIVALVIIAAERAIDAKKDRVAFGAMQGGVVSAPVGVATSATGFRLTRRITLAFLIISAVFLALVGILSIWDVISGEIVNKSISSLAIIAFSCLTIVIVCLDREKHNSLVSGQ